MWHILEQRRCLSSYCSRVSLGASWLGGGRTRESSARRRTQYAGRRALRRHLFIHCAHLPQLAAATRNGSFHSGRRRADRILCTAQLCCVVARRPAGRRPAAAAGAPRCCCCWPEAKSAQSLHVDPRGSGSSDAQNFVKPARTSVCAPNLRRRPTSALVPQHHHCCCLSTGARDMVSRSAAARSSCWLASPTIDPPVAAAGAGSARKIGARSRGKAIISRAKQYKTIR